MQAKGLLPDSNLKPNYFDVKMKGEVAALPELLSTLHHRTVEPVHIPSALDYVELLGMPFLITRRALIEKSDSSKTVATYHDAEFLALAMEEGTGEEDRASVGRELVLRLQRLRGQFEATAHEEEKVFLSEFQISIFPHHFSLLEAEEVCTLHEVDFYLEMLENERNEGS